MGVGAGLESAATSHVGHVTKLCWTHLTCAPVGQAQGRSSNTSASPPARAQNRHSDIFRGLAAWMSPGSSDFHAPRAIAAHERSRRASRSPRPNWLSGAPRSASGIPARVCGCGLRAERQRHFLRDGAVLSQAAAGGAHPANSSGEYQLWYQLPCLLPRAGRL